MDKLFQDLMRTLQEAQEAVRQELAIHAETRDTNMEPLLRLHRSVCDFGDQADVLFQMMFERGAERFMFDVVEDLCDFFREIEQRIEAMLGLRPEHRPDMV